VPKIQDRSVLLEPFVSITLNNEELTEDMTKYIDSVIVEDEAGKLSIGRIIVADADQKWLYDDRIKKNTPITITMGHYRANRLMLEGKIKNIDADFPETGIPTISIVAIDNAVRLVGDKKSRSWKSKKLSDVIIDVFAENGLAIEVEDTETVLEYVAQSNETDNDFAHRKAQEIGYQLFKTTSGVYYFGSEDKYGSPISTLEYRKGNMQIIRFSPSFQQEESDTAGSESSNSDVAKDGTVQGDVIAGNSSEEDSVSVDKATGTVKAR
jgi:phage protein D